MNCIMCGSDQFLQMLQDVSYAYRSMAVTLLDIEVLTCQGCGRQTPLTYNLDDLHRNLDRLLLCFLDVKHLPLQDVERYIECQAKFSTAVWRWMLQWNTPLVRIKEAVYGEVVYERSESEEG